MPVRCLNLRFRRRGQTVAAIALVAALNVTWDLLHTVRVCKSHISSIHMGISFTHHLRSDITQLRMSWCDAVRCVLVRCDLLYCTLLYVHWPTTTLNPHPLNVLPLLILRANLIFLVLCRDPIGWHLMIINSHLAALGDL